MWGASLTYPSDYFSRTIGALTRFRCLGPSTRLARRKSIGCCPASLSNAVNKRNRKWRLPNSGTMDAGTCQVQKRFCVTKSYAGRLVFPHEIDHPVPISVNGASSWHFHRTVFSSSVQSVLIEKHTVFSKNTLVSQWERLRFQSV